MSRAVGREVDGAAEPSPTEWGASGTPNLVTPRGLRLIDEEIDRIATALEDAAADERARLRRELRYWRQRRETARLVPTNPAPGAGGFGTRVTVRRGILMSDLLIVGEDEADPGRGRIAWTTPLARALEGAERGDVVEVEAGGRVEEIRVFAIGPGEG